MDIKQIYKFLGTDDALIQIALLTGFVQTLRCSNFLENPLSSICCAIIIAVIYSVFARIVINVCPEFLKPIMSIILILSMGYYIFLKKTCHSQTISNDLFSFTQTMTKDGLYNVKLSLGNVSNK